MKMFLTLALTLTGAFAMSSASASTPELLQHKINSLDGKPMELSAYEGKVILIVNVASKCGYTKQYAGLQQLHDKYADQGLVVLGVPCNQFGGQEPGSAVQIQQFCSATYGVQFPMTEKVDVNGPQASPLYKQLTSYADAPGKVRWNFEKFVIGKNGQIAGRYKSGVAPMSEELVGVIEAELAK